MTNTHDPLERVALLRLTDDEVIEGWSPERQRQLLEEIRTEAGAAPDRHRRRWVTAGAATLAAAAVAAVVVGVVSPGSPGGPSPAAAAAIEHLASVASAAHAPVIGRGQYAYSASDVLQLQRGRMVHIQSNQFWITTDGRGWDTGVGRHVPRQCVRVGPPPSDAANDPDFGDPTLTLINSLPSDPGQLQSYLSSHTHGERNNAEAVFVAVADLLRSGAGLTTAKIRGSLIAVLARTSYVSVERGVFDQRGRPATRVVFSDPHGLPDGTTSYHSLYFNPITAQLLEERDGGTANGTIVRNVDVYTARSVVDEVPAKFKSC